MFIFRARVGERRGEPRVLSLAIRLGINAIALWVASHWVRGFDIHGWQSLLAMAAIFAVVNTLITPVAQILGCAMTCATAGVFALVINAAMLALSVWIGDQFGVDVKIDGFWAALLAALLVTVTSWVLSTFVGRPLRRALR